MSFAGNQTVAPATGDKARLWSILVHALYLFGIGPLGLIMAYVKRPDFSGSIYEGHMTFAIRTFWGGVLFGLAAWALAGVGMEFIILFIGGIWAVVRVVVALTRAIDAKPMPNPKSWVI
ncbi:MAG: hypothetical protein PW843_29935 [Azospirillaceae bacterium]|nr:hypothetical protein [Azospirillaceae bacterium]